RKAPQSLDFLSNFWGAVHLKGSFIIHYFSMTNISEVNFYLTIVIINAVLPLINQRKSFF
ncbi:hypothetical protein V9022_09975, partial [Streptococcus agalactiae]|uniref:hypothetical protein n=1 Tax=Streptococcus agalactiae TaxID=1311 RepID=UPI00300F85AA